MKRSVSSIIVAGGQGSRMQSQLPKQFLQLNNRPIITYSISCMLEAFPEGEIIIVVPREFESLMQEILDRFFPDQDSLHVTIGGATRFDSSKNGVLLATKDCIMIHDAARPFINTSFLHRLYDEVEEHGNAIPALTCVESVRICKNSGSEIVDRNTVKLIQTPQAFDGKKLKDAFINLACKDSFTDDASVWEAAGHKVHLVDGINNNIKITSPDDMEVAQLLAPKLIGLFI